MAQRKRRQGKPDAPADVYNPLTGNRCFFMGEETDEDGEPRTVNRPGYEGAGQVFLPRPAGESEEDEGTHSRR